MRPVTFNIQFLIPNSSFLTPNSSPLFPLPSSLFPLPSPLSLPSFFLFLILPTKEFKNL